MIKSIAGAVAALILSSAAASAGFHEDWRQRVAATAAVDALARLYLELSLESTPTYGGSLGIHGSPQAPTGYDDRLPDYSAQALAQTYNSLVALHDRLAAVDVGKLPRAEQIDHRILSKRIALQRLQLDELGSMSDPMTYVQTLGAAFSNLVMRDYAPLEQRLRSFGARCAQTPRFLGQAETNLLLPQVLPTADQKRLALANLAAMTADNSLLRKVLPQLLAQSRLKARDVREIQRQCEAAGAAMDAFAARLREAYAHRPDGSWRLGPALYARQYDLYLDYPLAPSELLAAAEAALEARSRDMAQTARRIHDRYLKAAIDAGTLPRANKLSDAQVVRNVLAGLSEDRSTVDSLIADSYALADLIAGFVRRHDLMELPPTSKLRIENIPAHLSGQAVARIATAPPFEPQLDSVWFWDLPLLAQAESYLKEYNRAVLAEVYIHEGVPGHFVQLEYSNRAERIVPKVLYNGALVEGWASYIQTQMVDQGFTVYPDHPLGHELQKMANLKLQLRAILNAIIDIRLHTTDWPEAEAVKLMIERGFQEEGEAQGKIVRARLSSVQLASYFAGHRAILEILEEYRRRKGAAFTWKDFNQRLVGAGSPPFFALREHMLQD